MSSSSVCCETTILQRTTTLLVPLLVDSRSLYAGVLPHSSKGFLCSDMVDCVCVWFERVGRCYQDAICTTDPSSRHRGASRVLFASEYPLTEREKRCEKVRRRFFRILHGQIELFLWQHTSWTSAPGLFYFILVGG
jgi:hypothetical protein